MLKQEYRFGIYYFNREEPQDARLIEEVSFTVEGEDRNALDLAATEKMDDLIRGLKDGQYIDDIQWGDPQKIKPEEEWQ